MDWISGTLEGIIEVAEHNDSGKTYIIGHGITSPKITREPDWEIGLAFKTPSDYSSGLGIVLEYASDTVKLHVPSDPGFVGIAATVVDSDGTRQPVNIPAKVLIAYNALLAPGRPKVNQDFDQELKAVVNDKYFAIQTEGYEGVKAAIATARKKIDEERELITNEEAKKAQSVIDSSKLEDVVRAARTAKKTSLFPDETYAEQQVKKLETLINEVASLPKSSVKKPETLLEYYQFALNSKNFEDKILEGVKNLLRECQVLTAPLQKLKQEVEGRPERLFLNWVKNSLNTIKGSVTVSILDGLITDNDLWTRLKMREERDQKESEKKYTRIYGLYDAESLLKYSRKDLEDFSRELDAIASRLSATNLEAEKRLEHYPEKYFKRAPEYKFHGSSLSDILRQVDDVMYSFRLDETGQALLTVITNRVKELNIDEWKVDLDYLKYIKLALLLAGSDDWGGFGNINLSDSNDSWVSDQERDRVLDDIKNLIFPEEKLPVCKKFPVDLSGFTGTLRRFPDEVERIVNLVNTKLVAAKKVADDFNKKYETAINSFSDATLEARGCLRDGKISECFNSLKPKFKEKVWTIFTLLSEQDRSLKGKVNQVLLSVASERRPDFITLCAQTTVGFEASFDDEILERKIFSELSTKMSQKIMITLRSILTETVKAEIVVLRGMKRKVDKWTEMKIDENKFVRIEELNSAKESPISDEGHDFVSVINKIASYHGLDYAANQAVNILFSQPGNISCLSKDLKTVLVPHLVSSILGEICEKYRPEQILNLTDSAGGNSGTVTDIFLDKKLIRAVLFSSGQTIYYPLEGRIFIELKKDEEEKPQLTPIDTVKKITVAETISHFLKNCTLSVEQTIGLLTGAIGLKNPDPRWNKASYFNEDDFVEGNIKKFDHVLGIKLLRGVTLAAILDGVQTIAFINQEEPPTEELDNKVLKSVTTPTQQILFLPVDPEEYEDFDIEMSSPMPDSELIPILDRCENRNWSSINTESFNAQSEITRTLSVLMDRLSLQSSSGESSDSASSHDTTVSASLDGASVSVSSDDSVASSSSRETVVSASSEITSVFDPSPNRKDQEKRFLSRVDDFDEPNEEMGEQDFADLDMDRIRTESDDEGGKKTFETRGARKPIGPDGRVIAGNRRPGKHSGEEMGDRESINVSIGFEEDPETANLSSDDEATDEESETGGPKTGLIGRHVRVVIESNNVEEHFRLRRRLFDLTREVRELTDKLVIGEED